MVFLQLITVTLSTGTVSLPGCRSWAAAPSPAPCSVPAALCPLLCARPWPCCSSLAVSSSPVCSSFSLTLLTITLNSFTKRYHSLAGDTPVTPLLPQPDPTDSSAPCAKCVDKIP